MPVSEPIRTESIFFVVATTAKLYISLFKIRELFTMFKFPETSIFCLVWKPLRVLITRKKNKINKVIANGNNDKSSILIHSL